MTSGPGMTFPHGLTVTLSSKAPFRGYKSLNASLAIATVSGICIRNTIFLLPGGAKSLCRLYRDNGKENVGIIGVYIGVI